MPQVEEISRDIGLRSMLSLIGRHILSLKPNRASTERLKSPREEWAYTCEAGEVMWFRTGNRIFGLESGGY